jgi:hypothetical protein
MEKKKLPNAQASMILGITSFIGCCCTSGFLGLVLSGIGLYLGKKDEKLLLENPEEYNPGSSNTWKIINIVSFSLSAVFVIYFIYMKATGKDIEQQKQLMDMIKGFK